MNLSKSDIVHIISGKILVSPLEIKQVIDCLIKVIPHQLDRGDSIEIRGFGRFTTKVRKLKKARNIGRGTTIIIPEHKEKVFKFSKEIK